MVPGDMPFPLELQDLQLNVALAGAGEGRSRLDAELLASSRRMGSVKARANTLAHATAAGGLRLVPAAAKSVTVEAAVADLGWTSRPVGDALASGGSAGAGGRRAGRPDRSRGASR